MGGGKKAIASAAHLADDAVPALTELETSLALAGTAYQRWITRCAAAAGLCLPPLEVLILLTVRHRDRFKRLADIALVLDIDDMHLVTYAVRKLDAAGLVETRRDGKEKLVGASPAGRDFCNRYRAVRDGVLAGAVAEDGPGRRALTEAAALLRRMSAQYNQAARAAAAR